MISPLQPPKKKVKKWAKLLYCHIQNLDVYRPEDWTARAEEGSES